MGRLIADRLTSRANPDWRSIPSTRPSRPTIAASFPSTTTQHAASSTTGCTGRGGAGAIVARRIEPSTDACAPLRTDGERCAATSGFDWVASASSPPPGVGDTGGSGRGPSPANQTVPSSRLRTKELSMRRSEPMPKRQTESPGSSSRTGVAGSSLGLMSKNPPG